MHVNVLNRYGTYCRSDSLYTFAQCAAKACEVSDPKRPILAIEYYTSGIGPAGNCFLMGATMQAPVQPCPTDFLACNCAGGLCQGSSNSRCVNGPAWAGSMWSTSNSEAHLTSQQRQQLDSGIGYNPAEYLIMHPHELMRGLCLSYGHDAGSVHVWSALGRDLSVRLL